MTQINHEFSNDRPLSSKADDKLNRAAFADRVAGVLRGLPTGTGLVVGLHGPWGDGKTTVLNILRSDLESDANMAVVEFNPWRFTDEPSMLAGFFRVLAGVIRAKLTTKGEDIAGWVEKLGRYATVVDDRFGKAGDIAGAKAEASLEELRTRLSDALAKADKRIVVLVDDIDRLDKHETHTLFRLIKACADFPNVWYVLAFDDVAVAKSLGERYGAGDEASGRAFLEKIIQVPLKLPVAMKEDLRSLCFQQVEQALNAAGCELSKEEVGRFISGFDRGISIRLDTPRAAKRYGNALMFALPMLKGEVNTVELLLLEAVRAFYPAIYDCIRSNHDEFVGKTPMWGNGHEKESKSGLLLKALMKELDTDEAKSVQGIIGDLFPKMKAAFGGPTYADGFADRWAKEKRVCSPDYCPRYFTYAVPKSDVRDSEMDALYTKAASGNEAEVRGILEAFFTGGKARRVIERMRQRDKDADLKAVPALCIAVASLAKHIPNPPSPYSFMETPSQAGILISHLINRLPAGAARVDLAKRVIAAADPLWFGDECLRWLHVTDDADKADSYTLTNEEVKEVGKALVERIKSRAVSGEPLFSVTVRQEALLLFEWARVEGRQPVQDHLASVFATDHNNLGLFLQAMAPQRWGYQDVTPHVGGFKIRHLHTIDSVFAIRDLAELIQKHLPDRYDAISSFPENILGDPEDGIEVHRGLARQLMFMYLHKV